MAIDLEHIEPGTNEAYVDNVVRIAVSAETERAKKAEEQNAAEVAKKQAALDASQVTALNSGINAQRVYDIVSLAGGDSNSGKSVRTIAGEEMMKLVEGAPDTYDTLKEIADWIAKDETGTQAIVNQVAGLTSEVAKKADTTAVANLLDGKVNKVPGKDLSTNDYTTTEKEKLAGIEVGAQKNPDLTPYAKKSDLEGFATKEELNEVGNIAQGASDGASTALGEVNNLHGAVVQKRDKTDNVAVTPSYSSKWNVSYYIHSDSEELKAKLELWFSNTPTSISGSDSEGWNWNNLPAIEGYFEEQRSEIEDTYTYITYVSDTDLYGFSIIGQRPVVVTPGEPYVTPTGVKNIAIPKYEFVDAAKADGKVTVAPYTNAKLISDGTAFEVAVAEGDGKTRDCVLCVECGDTVPTITWGANFHPRTDAETDFACEAGVRNVYWITEYAEGEFCVAGWQETEGGNAA